MDALRIEGLNKRYKKFSIKDLNLTLPGGSIMGLVGENGAGKTTLLKLIMGISVRDSGKISFFCDEEFDRCIIDNCDPRILNNYIGYVPDDVGFPKLAKADHIGKVMSAAYSEWDMKAFDDYLDRFSIPENTVFEKMSKGTRMKLGIAAALSHNAKLLILDEAMAGLDPVAKDDIISILFDYTREEDHSILISSHIVSDLEKMCDYIAFMKNGSLILCEEKDRLFENYGIIMCSKEQLDELSPDAVIGRNDNEYGSRALIVREKVPEGFEIVNADLDELFVFMMRGNKK